MPPITYFISGFIKKNLLRNHEEKCEESHKKEEEEPQATKRAINCYKNKKKEDSQTPRDMTKTTTFIRETK